MTISITVPDVTFTKVVSNVLMPHIESAVAFYLYGGDAAQSVINRTLNPAANGVVAGAPTYNANSANISNTAGFATGFLVDTPFTQVFVGKLLTGSCSPIGREPGGEAQLDMIQVVGGTPYVLRTYANGVNAQGLNVPLASLQQFNMLGARWGGTGTKPNIYFFDGATFTSATASVNMTQTVTPTKPLRVGACGSGTGTWEAAASVFFDRVLTDGELLEVKLYLKGLLASRGVTML